MPPKRAQEWGEKLPQEWEEKLPRGPPVCALCFGINNYDNLISLSNCERDAHEIVNRVRSLSDGRNGKCVAKLHEGPQLRDKEVMKSAVIDFLRQIDKEAPPRYIFWKVGKSPRTNQPQETDYYKMRRMVLISFSGHGIQDGAEFLMVPSAASSGEYPDKLKDECLSHNELFSILYSEIHLKTQVSTLLFALCTVSFNYFIFHFLGFHRIF